MVWLCERWLRVFVIMILNLFVCVFFSSFWIFGLRSDVLEIVWFLYVVISFRLFRFVYFFVRCIWFLIEVFD